MDELYDQTGDFLAGRETIASAFAHRIAFNCIPQIDVFLDDGATKEEWKMVVETRKILGDDSIGVAVTCVRVPVLRRDLFRDPTRPHCAARRRASQDRERVNAPGRSRSPPRIAAGSDREDYSESFSTTKRPTGAQPCARTSSERKTADCGRLPPQAFVIW